MTLGSTLQQARTGAGMSLDDLAERTSIRSSVLWEFENDNFSKCGGETYARGHLRNLAHVLGVDPNIFLELYSAEHLTQKRPMYDLLVASNVTAPKSEKTRISLKTLAVISGIIVLIGIAGQIIFSNLQHANKTAAKPPIATASATPSPSTTPSPTPTATAPSAVPAAVAVQVTATRASSWLFVSDGNGATLFSGLLAKGGSRTFSSSDKVNIRFGNAGGVDVVVNGKAIPALGSSGEVVDRTFGPIASN